MELLHSQKTIDSGGGASTGAFVDVEEVRDGVVVLENGSLRAILLVSSINFELKSSEEQEAIIYHYQTFLNSLDFPTQIIISSRKYDITPYLSMLSQKEKVQKNELLRLQISEYSTFIKDLTDRTNIMSKFFYIVVPFSPIESKKSGVMERITSLFNPSAAVILRREQFETYKSQLAQRVGHVISGLEGCGIHTTTLTTEEIIELLYNSYNPSLTTQKIVSDAEGLEIV